MGVPDKRANSVCSKQCRAELWAPPCCSCRCPTAPRCWHKEGQTAFNPSLPAAWPHLRTVAYNSPPTGCSVPLQSTLQPQRLRNGIFLCIFLCRFLCCCSRAVSQLCWHLTGHISWCWGTKLLLHVKETSPCRNPEPSLSCPGFHWGLGTALEVPNIHFGLHKSAEHNFLSI